MRGFVPTPDAIVDRMVEKLFADKPPGRDSTLLDPGCGPGAFIEGVLRWCDRNGREPLQIIGYESEPGRYAEAVERFSGIRSVKILREDFLSQRDAAFDYVIGNPPYVPITELSEREKAKFRRYFTVARGRFDLYLLFFEQALRSLAPRGRLVFITPEKFLYVDTAKPLRQLLSKYHVREIELLNEETFGSLITYPTITTIDDAVVDDALTTVVLRDNSRRCIVLPQDGSSLQPLVYGDLLESDNSGGASVLLADVAVRISCGPATGADAVFVKKTASLQPAMVRYAFPTVSGRDLGTSTEIHSDKSMLIPYDEHGRLLPFRRLGALGSYLSQPAVRSQLSSRTCVLRKPWYAFHDSVPLSDMLRPKLLCKDITAQPYFWIDRAGSIVPRHTVYYIVPFCESALEELQDYLNGTDARAWLRANCQRAANGFLRLQSSVLKRVPLPPEIAKHSPGTREESFRSSKRSA